MNWIQKHWLALLLMALPFLLLGLFWNQLPEEVPVHWNLNGEVDRYGSKMELFILPVINVLIYFAILYLPRLDPKRNHAHYENILERIGLSLLVFMLVIFSTTLLAALGYKLAITQVVLYAVTGLFLVIGNYMGKFRPNYFMGIRTPWTLESERVWVKTHRFAGALWVSASMGLLVWALFQGNDPSKLFFVFMGYVLLISLLPIGYSYWLYQRLASEEDDS